MSRTTIVSILILSVLMTTSVFANDGIRENPAKGIQDAVVISEHGVFDHTYSQVSSKSSYSYRIKFFSQKGIDDYGTIILTYYPEEENIINIEGKVLLKDKTEIKLTKKDIFEKVISGKRGRKEREIRIVLPSLEEGAIAEYSFEKSFSGMDKMTYWPFQGELYTVESKVTFVPWPGIRYGYNTINSMKTPEVSEGRNTGGHKSVIITQKDIKPLKKENFSLAYDSLREAIIFYYHDSNREFQDYWTEYGPEYYRKYLKKYVKPCKESRAVVEELAGSESALLEEIYNYVISHFHCIQNLSKEEKASLDEKYYDKLRKADTLKKIFKCKYVSQWQINYILASLIKTAIPDAEIEFVLYVPWDEFIFNININTLGQFSDRILRVHYGERTYLLDPAKRFYPMNQIDWATKGVPALVLGEKGATIEKFVLDKPTDNESLTTCDVTFGDEKLLLKRVRKLNRYSSYSFRRIFHFYAEDEIKDVLEEAVKDSFGDEATLQSFSINDRETIENPLSLEETIEIPYEFEEVGDNILFRFTGLVKKKENPFSTDERISNIVFPYPYINKQIITYHLPEGFSIKSLPKAYRINEKFYLYRINYTKTDDTTFTVSVDETLQGNMFSKKAHQFLYETYQAILETNRAAAVLSEEL